MTDSSDIISCILLGTLLFIFCWIYFSSSSKRSSSQSGGDITVRFAKMNELFKSLYNAVVLRQNSEQNDDRNITTNRKACALSLSFEVQVGTMNKHGEAVYYIPTDGVNSYHSMEQKYTTLLDRIFLPAGKKHKILCSRMEEKNDVRFAAFIHEILNEILQDKSGDLRFSDDINKGLNIAALVVILRIYVDDNSNFNLMTLSVAKGTQLSGNTFPNDSYAYDTFEILGRNDSRRMMSPYARKV